MLVVVGFADAVRDGPQNEADITNLAERGVNHTQRPYPTAFHPTQTQWPPRTEVGARRADRKSVV